MKFSHTLSGRLFLGLIVATPTIFLSTIGAAFAQPIAQRTIIKPIDNSTTFKQPNPGVAKLVQQAKSDPQFYRALVENPEQTLASINYLDPATKQSLARLIPQEFANGGISEAAADCVCTGCCVTRIGKPGSYRLDPLYNRRLNQIEQPVFNDRLR